MSPSTTWILSLIAMLAPPARMAALPSFPGMRETVDQWEARERAIAADIAGATSDAREQAVLVAIASHESGFARDADLGPCYRGPKSDGPRCDGGLAASVWQLHVKDPEHVFADRPLAARTALAAVRRSARRCAPKYGPEGALRAFASGSCDRGAKESSDMVRLALRLLREHRPPPKE